MAHLGTLASNSAPPLEWPPDERSALVIRNPKARRAPSEGELLLAAAPLRAAGWTIDVVSTRAAGEAVELARGAASAGAGIVFACGGDGTVREVVEGLAGSASALGVVPAGTANVWASEAGIPRGPARALRALADARRARVDSGLANGARFLLMASIGLDAATLAEVERGGHKPRLGRAAFVLPALRQTVRAAAVRTRVSVDGVAIERDVLMAVAGNSRLYGGLARLTSRARIDDGLIDVAVLSGGTGDGKRHRAGLAWYALRSKLGDAAASGHAGIDYLVGRHVELESDEALAVQLDGDAFGETASLTIEVDRASVVVLVSRRPNALLGER